MASPQPKQPSDGTWTFVSTEGEVEEVDDSSSSSSSEFVRFGEDAVSYHHLHVARKDNSSDSELSISSDEGKEDSRPSNIVLASTSPLQTTVEPEREESPVSDISSASLLEDSTSTSILSSGVSSASSSGADGARLETAEHDSDVDIIPNEKKDVCNESKPGTTSQSTRMSSVARALSSTSESCHSTPIQTGNESALSRQMSNQSDGSVQLRLVLRQRSDSTSDSDSDFSHLETVSTADQSDSATFLQTEDKDHVTSSVDESFRFVDEDQLGGGEEGCNEGDLLQDTDNVKGAMEEEGSDGTDHGSNDQQPGDDNQDEHVQALNLNLNADDADEIPPVRDDDQNPVGLQGMEEAPVVEGAILDEESDQEDRDTGTESGVEDDRIESDQSEGFPADDDDLSFSNVGLENIVLHEPNRSRQYFHKPNKYLSGTLSLVVLMTGWMALGLGIGHLLGSSQPTGYQYLDHFHDDLMLCQRQKSDLYNTLIRERRDQDQREEFLMVRLARLQDSVSRRSQEIEDWKIKANDMEQQISDLKIENGRLKYNRHPANLESRDSSNVLDPVLENVTDIEKQTKQASLVEDSASSEFLDSTKDPSEDSEQPQFTSEWENQTEKLREELNLARGRADMWQLLYLSERQRKTPRKNVTPDALSCLALLTPKINFSEIVSVVNKTILRGIEKLPNVTQITSFINKSLETDNLFRVSEVHAFLEEVGNLWFKMRSSGTENPPGESISEQNDFGDKQKYRSRENRRPRRHDGHHGGNGKRQKFNSEFPRWSKTVQDFLNETQQSVSRVSEEIKEQWKMVRNFSREMWKKQGHKVAKLRSRVVDQVSKVASKLREKIHNKSKGWFGQKPSSNKQRATVRKALKKIFQQVKSSAPSKDKYVDGGVSAVMVDKLVRFHEKHGSNYPNKKSEERVKCQIKWWTLNTAMNLQDFPQQCAKYVFRWQTKQAKKYKLFSEKHKGGSKDWKDRTRSEKLKKQKDLKIKKGKQYNKYKEEQNDKDFRKKTMGTIGGTKRRTDKNRQFDHKRMRKETRHDGTDGKNNHHCGKSDHKRHRLDRHPPGHGRHSKHHGKEERKSNQWHKHNREERGKPQPQNQDWGSAEIRNNTKDDHSISEREENEAQDNSWYIRKMQDKKKVREAQDWAAGDSNWMFARAEDRDFHRNKPDNWYFRRSDGRHKGKYFKSQEKYHRETLRDDHNDYDDDRDDGDMYYEGFRFHGCFEP